MSSRTHSERRHFVIIGAGKCGTTSLHYYLSLHPQISMSWEKELNFFVADLNWTRGMEWYRSSFPAGGIISGEASPKYTQFPFVPGVPQRMFSAIPEALLIYILRDPIERIISEYIERLANGEENRSLESVLEHPETAPYVAFSRYYMQLEQYLQYYSPHSVLLLTTERLLAHRVDTLRSVFRFLGVDPTFTSPKFSALKHTSSRQRAKNRLGVVLKRAFDGTVAGLLPLHMRIRIGQVASIPFSRKIDRPLLDEYSRKKLARNLKPDVDELRQFSGLTFDEWRI